MKGPLFNDDLRLVKGCIARKSAAWSGFVRKYSRLIFISIDNRLKNYGITLPPQDIEDIRQNILTAIWKDHKLEQVKNRRNISYWVAVVSGNMAIEYIRRMRDAAALKPGACFENMSQKDIIELIPASGLDPRDALSANEFSKEVNKLIRAMPDKEKLVIRLSLLYGKKYDEIADMLRMPEGTVACYIKRAKDKLRKGLKDFF